MVLKKAMTEIKDMIPTHNILSSHILPMSILDMANIHLGMARPKTGKVKPYNRLQARPIITK